MLPISYDAPFQASYHYPYRSSHILCYGFHFPRHSSAVASTYQAIVVLCEQLFSLR